VSSINDKVLGNKLILPESVNMFVPAKTAKEAHYICAVLNSSSVREGLRMLSSKSKSGLSASIIRKIRLDRYDSKNPLHKKLSQLSQKAHSLGDKDIGSLRKIEEDINKTVKQLYKTKS